MKANFKNIHWKEELDAKENKTEEDLITLGRIWTIGSRPIMFQRSNATWGR